MSCRPQLIPLGGPTLKRPTSDHEAARLAALAPYQQADALPENALDRLTTLTARLFRVPTAFVSLIDDQRQFFASRYRNELDRLTADEAAISLPRTLQMWGLRRDGQEFPAEVSFSGWREGGERLVG